MVDYLEIDDYNQEQFYELENNWDEYKSIIEEWTEPTPQDKDMTYNIFTMEQAVSAIQELSNICDSLRVPANNAINMIEEFIKQYTAHYNREEV